MNFAGKADAVSERLQVVRDAFGIGADSAVIPGAAVPEGVEASVEFGSARGAHRHAEIGAVEDERLFCEGVEMRGFGVLASVEWEIGEGTIVRDNDEDIWLGGCQTIQRKKQEESE